VESKGFQACGSFILLRMFVVYQKNMRRAYEGLLVLWCVFQQEGPHGV
jgi:hypothetical protein